MFNITDCSIRDELRNKIRFVQGIEYPLTVYMPSIMFVRYEVFVDRDAYNNGRMLDVREFLCVKFKGGMSVRNSCGNSISAIVRELGKLIDGGYYDEVDYYNRLKENPRYIQFSL